MTDDRLRRIFTAEIQRRQRHGVVPPPTMAAAPADSVSNSDLMAEIGHLRTAIERSLNTRTEEADVLRVGIKELSDRIDKTKREIAALRHPDAEDDRLIAAADELDAIVAATENATHVILETAERIDTLAQAIQDNVLKGDTDSPVVDAAEISNLATSIFEACNFQDITGQRINKVVKTLSFIEERVGAMIEVWGRQEFEALPRPVEVAPEDERHLLNGPQLAEQGVSQDDIDKLFD